MCGVSQACAVFLRWMLIGYTSIAVILSCLAVSSCRFLEYDHGDNLSSGSAGLYRYHDDQEGCVDYHDDRDIDDLEKKARAGAVVAPLAGSVALALIMIEFCCCKVCCGRLLIGSSLLVAQITQGLSFLFFGSETYCDGDLVEEIVDHRPCTVSNGSVFSIIALILYFFAGALVFCTPKPEPMAVTHYRDEATPDSKSVDSSPEPNPSAKTETKPELV